MQFIHSVKSEKKVNYSNASLINNYDIIIGYSLPLSPKQHSISIELTSNSLLYHQAR